MGKLELVEFTENETLEAAIKAIGESTECGIAVWKRRSVQKGLIENAEMRHQRFVGILNPLDVVAFLARDDCLNDQEKAMKTTVSEVVVPDNQTHFHGQNRKIGQNRKKKLLNVCLLRH